MNRTCEGQKHVALAMARCGDEAIRRGSQPGGHHRVSINHEALVLDFVAGDLTVPLGCLWLYPSAPGCCLVACKLLPDAYLLLPELAAALSPKSAQDCLKI